MNPVAYFSMEVGVNPDMATYSGGLGILAGDTLKAAADLAMPVVAVSLLHRKGYFRQALNEAGEQSESPLLWQIEDFLTPINHEVNVTIEGRQVAIKAWRYDIKGESGHVVPLYLLDTQVAGNTTEDQELTSTLYGGDERYRLSQEIVLGIGGVRLLQKIDLPYEAKDLTYHMNEGHASLLTLALLENEDEATVKQRCVFTTHTPVPAGHDTFPADLVGQVLGPEGRSRLEGYGLCEDKLNMTHLGMRFSRFVNGVAMRHAEVSRKMFPGAQIAGITNGIHSTSWVADGMADLFDETIPDWRRDSRYLKNAVDIDLGALEKAHRVSKQALVDEVNARTGAGFDIDTFTIGFARRAATYKRADLIVEDIERLQSIGKRDGRIQIVFAGKAHPKDIGGKALIKSVVEKSKNLDPKFVSLVYLENYDMKLGRLICGGVDLWLNNPIKPLEASGTSGMKAALNGIPSLSTLDGWWVEGCYEGVTGWEIEDSIEGMDGGDVKEQKSEDAARHLYEKLDQVIVPMYYNDREAYLSIMRNAISINGPFFNTHRMMEQYRLNAYQTPEG